MNYGWAGTFQEYLKLDLQNFIKQLYFHAYGNSSAKNNEEQRKRDSQVNAWKDSFHKLQKILYHYRYEEGSIIFEYEILRGSGRRPDVLILYNGYLIVIECKSFNGISASEYIQTSLYVRDLQHYHSKIHGSNTKVIGALFLTKNNKRDREYNEDYQISICSNNSLHVLFKKCSTHCLQTSITMNEVLTGDYEPSPSMVEAARAIYNHKPLPKIKAVASSNFIDVQQTVESIIEEAKATNTHHLVLVSGEPGAGKTYLGLNIAHDFENAVYLSGNKPLIDVLQDALRNKTFVQGLYGYKMSYLEGRRIPKEQIIIFDEAQRAWDAEKVDHYLKKIPPQGLSEPDIIMQIATTNKPWSVTVGLIGEGQEIYSGEEGGLALWNKAVAGKKIIVHAKHNHRLFQDVEDYNTHKHLHLNCSFRAHAALDYYAIINSLLSGDFNTTKQLVTSLPKSRYNLFVTRNLDLAKHVVSKLYIDDTKTTGILCASGADRQKEVPVLPKEYYRYNATPNAAFYFNHFNSEFHSNRLRYSATEFQTQGLELDTAIVHWDDDLYLQNGIWKGQHFQYDVKDPFQIKLNSYRVILTRGRDCTIIYIPPKQILDETWNVLTNYIGIPVLS
ncbi:DNA/RNA helicase domain-containing protein [Bacillus nitratireducens]|uniref:DNA/RNA helicase domain-containing protein n=1 Tax=Bacillus nitratireducens TaxID=2026193 RepID=UPI003D302B6D